MEKRNVPKLRFKGFEDEWKEYKLGDLCKISSGSTPSKLKREYFNGNIFWVTSGELKNKYLKDTIDKITESAKIDTNLKIYDKGTVVIAIYGLEAQGTRGSSTILNTKATISQACMALEVNNKIINEYLYYWYEKYGEIIGLKYAQGTKQQNLSTNLVSELNVKLPSLEEQTKIANFLSNVDNIIEEQEGKVKDLEQYKKGMMQKIFKQEVKFKDENGGEYTKWEEKKLGEVMFEPKKMKEENPIEIELLTVKLHCKGVELTGKYPNVTSNGRPYYKRFKDEILIGRQNMHNGGIGIVNEECDGKIASNAISSYRAIENNNTIYLLKYLSDKNYYKRIDFLLGGTGQKEISKKELENLKVKLPCLEEQTKIANFLSNIDNIIKEENKKLEDLKLWKKGLLQQMFV